MRDIIADVDRWRAQGEAVALATVIETWGSAPRQAGAKMALTPAGRIAGSVSGGCVEGAVYEAGTEVLKTGRPQLLRFGVADETAWSVGLACGGSIEVFVKPLDPTIFDRAKQALADERAFAVATVVHGPEPALGQEMLVYEDGEVAGELPAGLTSAAAEAARRALAEGSSRRAGIAVGVELFADVNLPSPMLVIIGGVHIAGALTALAATLGYRTVVVDPRRAFGARERFPHADQLIQAWPDEALGQIRLTRSTAVAALTHDPKLDDPALKIALASEAFYVGALGSRRTQEGRRKRLLADGLSEAQLARLRGPIGLDIGARTPEEIALAVMAEVVAARRSDPQRSI